MFFCTSMYFCEVYDDRMFSVPSTTPVCSAWYTSEKAITCGNAPSVRSFASSTFDDWMRIFSPLTSAGVRSGRLAEITWKPPLQ